MPVSRSGMSAGERRLDGFLEGTVHVLLDPVFRLCAGLCLAIDIIAGSDSLWRLQGCGGGYLIAWVIDLLILIMIGGAVVYAPFAILMWIWGKLWDRKQEAKSE